MKRFQQWKSNFVVLLLAVVGLAALAVAGSLLNIGESLARIHPVFEIAFYLLVAGLAGWLIVKPVVEVFRGRLERLDDFLDESAEPSKERQAALARWMLHQPTTEDEELARRLEYGLTFDKDMTPDLRSAIQRKEKEVNAVIRDKSRIAFVAVTVSQNGPLDVFMLLFLNLALIRDIVRTLGVRPSIRDLIKLYAVVLVGAIITEQIDDIDLSEFLPAIGSFFAKSLMQGVGAAFVTLRVGYLTRKYLFAGGRSSIRNDKPAARAEARRTLPQVILSSLSDLPKSIARRIERLMKKEPVAFATENE